MSLHPIDRYTNYSYVLGLKLAALALLVASITTAIHYGFAGPEGASWLVAGVGPIIAGLMMPFVGYGMAATINHVAPDSDDRTLLVVWSAFSQIFGAMLVILGAIVLYEVSDGASIAGLCLVALCAKGSKR